MLYRIFFPFHFRHACNKNKDYSSYSDVQQTPIWDDVCISLVRLVLVYFHRGHACLTHLWLMSHSPLTLCLFSDIPSSVQHIIIAASCVISLSQSLLSRGYPFIIPQFHYLQYYCIPSMCSSPPILLNTLDHLSVTPFSFALSLIFSKVLYVLWYLTHSTWGFYHSPSSHSETN